MDLITDGTYTQKRFKKLFNNITSQFTMFNLGKECTKRKDVIVDNKLYEHISSVTFPF